MDAEQFKEQEEPVTKKVKLEEVVVEKVEEEEKKEEIVEKVEEEKKDVEMKEEKGEEEEGSAVADEFEMSVGIRRYLNPDVAGFTGILKDRYSDFIVNEVTPQGEVVHLTDITSLPKEDEPAKGADKPEGEAGEGTAPAAAATSPEEALAAIIGAEAAKNFFEWAAKAQEEKEGEDDNNGGAKPKFEFPILEDRDKRMAIHSFVKENFKNINTTTENK